MKSTVGQLFIASMLAMVSSAVLAQSDTDPEMLLTRASHARMVDGDLEAAISIYHQLAMSPSIKRAYVATALVELGDTYQLLGSAEAVPVYERVLSEFGDQPEPFQQASSKLNMLLASNSKTAPKAKAQGQHVLLMSEVPPFAPEQARTYDFSPDGTRMVFHAPVTAERKARFPKLMRELYLQDTHGSVRRPLIENAADWEFINLPRWSPDGKSILYLVYKADGGKPQRQIRQLDLATGASRQLEGQGMLEGSVNGLTWMPDSRGFVVLRDDGVWQYDMEGSLKRHFEEKVDHMTRIGNVSPDGRFLLYHQVDENKEDHQEMGIWVLDLTSGTRKQVSEEPGFEGWPVWSRDGASIYYVSGAEVSRNVYRRKFNSADLPKKITSYSNASAIYPMQVADKLTFTLMRDNHTVLASRSGAEARTIVRGVVPMLSPAGDLLYYLDPEPDKTGLWVTPLDEDSTRQLVQGNIITSYGPKSLLSPDGTQLAYAKHEDGATSLYLMPASGGASQKLYSTPGIRHLIPSWSPDSKEIAFAVGGDMMVISNGGGEPQVLASVQRWESWSIEWSPDGTQLAAFAYLENEPQNHIMLVARNSGEMTRLTPPSEDQYKEILDWHPGGQRISYMYYNTQDHNGSRVIELGNGQIKDIANLPDPMWDYAGNWGPDLRYYFISTERGMGNLWQLYSFDEKTGDYATVRKVKDQSVSIPTWSGDGHTMVWAETEPVRQMWMLTDF